MCDHNFFIFFVLEEMNGSLCICFFLKNSYPLCYFTNEKLYVRYFVKH